MKMTIAYIAHPISGNIEANLADICRIVKKINLQYPMIMPFVPYYADVVAMDDRIPEERARGIQNDVEIINRKIPDQLWLTGKTISPGMEAEAEAARANGIPVYNYINKL